MKTRTKLALAATIAAVAVGVGTSVGVAASGDGDAPLEGAVKDRATDAALESVGEGTVVDTESDGSGYGVEVRLGDGSRVEVELDSEYRVTGTEPDDAEGAGGAEDDAGQSADD